MGKEEIKYITGSEASAALGTKQSITMGKEEIKYITGNEASLAL